MKQAISPFGGIVKSSGLPASPEQLDQINKLTRRTFSAEEVYVFSVILCDNEVDRDFEQFTEPALQKLSKLFMGKTGVFDHNPKSTNQTARIFGAQVVCDPHRLTKNKEPYYALRAEAYMVRCAKNEDLILEIDAGIKKEVSVGCQIGSVTCSVCRADMKSSPCRHQKGKVYSGKLCTHILSDPTDAFEWSFVAVPAQPAAGVTKHLGNSTGSLLSADELVERLSKSASDSGECVINLSELAKIRELVCEHQRYKQHFEDHILHLRSEVVKLAAICEPHILTEDFEKIAERLDAQELTILKEAYSEKAKSAFCAPVPQLAPVFEKRDERKNTAFCI